MRRGRPRHDDVLTPREWQVLDLLREDLTNEQIAARLRISPDTAKFHVSEILTKLGVGSRREAATWQGRPKVTFGFGPLVELLHKMSSVSPVKLAGASTIAVAGAALVLLAIGVVLGNDGESLGKIAFVREGNIWVQELPNGAPYQLTDKGESSMPRWSPSGEWLSFLTDGGESPGRPDLWLVRADGSNERLIEAAGFTAYWLPEADERLVYLTRGDETVAEDADGRNREILSQPFTDTNGERVVRYAYPESMGQVRVVYIEARYPADDAPERPANPVYQGIGVSNADGSGARQILPYETDSGRRTIMLGLSSDVSQVIFSTYSEEAGEFIQDGLPLSAIRIDGGPARDLGLTAIFTLPTSRSEAGWALVTGSPRESWTNKRIAVIAPDGTSYALLTDPIMAALSPAWSPDSAQIAFVAAPDLGPGSREQALAMRRIWVMNADGTSQRQLTSGEGFRDAWPTWAADGQHILFARMGIDDPCYYDGYDLMLYSLKDASLQEVASDLALFGTMNERDVLGEVPECDFLSGPVTDTFGSLNLSSILSWWQPQDK